MASSYENSDGLHEGQANVVTGTGPYAYAKYGMSNEPYKNSRSSNMDAGVDNNPIYFEAGSKQPPNPPPSQPHPPQLPPPNQHYNVPTSNKSIVYERMDSFQRVQSPNDQVRPLVSHENTPIAEDDFTRRVTADNPVYNRGERMGSEHKRTYRGKTESPVEEYDAKVRTAKCDSKAFMMFLLMLILFLISAASLVLSVVNIITPLGCKQCTDGSVVSMEHLQSLQKTWHDSLQELNQSFTGVVKQGPAGINGSRGPPGPPGPEVTEGSVDLSDHCSVSTSQCTITNPGERSCSTPGKVLSHGETVQTMGQWCIVRMKTENEQFTVLSTALETIYTTFQGESPRCTCTVNLVSGRAVCEYRRIDCDFSSINVTMIYNN